MHLFGLHSVPGANLGTRNTENKTETAPTLPPGACKPVEGEPDGEQGITGELDYKIVVTWTR